jgi:ornithine carbamoyltransferase
MELAWLGDGNNVLHSLIEAAGLLGFNIRAGIPSGYEPDAGFVARAREAGVSITLTQDPLEAAKGAQVVVTDTWVSMGQPGGDAVIAAMEPYQVNEAVMAAASPEAWFLHCLPAHRGEEVTDAVIDGPRSLVWDEAENRIHAQKSVLLWALGAL